MQRIRFCVRIKVRYHGSNWREEQWELSDESSMKSFRHSLKGMWLTNWILFGSRSTSTLMSKKVLLPGITVWRVVNILLYRRLFNSWWTKRLIEYALRLKVCFCFMMWKHFVGILIIVFLVPIWVDIYDIEIWENFPKHFNELSLWSLKF